MSGYGDETPQEKRPHEIELILGSSLGVKRKPRVRFVKGRKGFHREYGRAGTRRAAFRFARQHRDKNGETRPLRVWPIHAHCFAWGVSLWLESQEPLDNVDKNEDPKR